MRMDYLHFIIKNHRFLAFGFSLTFFSSVGQTYFISVFGPAIREEFNLSHGEFGAYYALGTITSAACLVWAGRIIDRIDLRYFTTGLIILTACACLIMATVTLAPILALALFSLRFTGQGLMNHAAVTSMARYFDSGRGRAISFAMLGLPTAVAIFPFFGVTLIETIGWRETWLVSSLILILFFLPFTIWLLKDHKVRHQSYLRRAMQFDLHTDTSDASPTGRNWTPKEVLHDKRFYMIGLSIMASSFIVTGFFFHQAHLAASKSWTPAWMASAFVGFTFGSILGSLSIGQMIDRTGAARLLPYFLIPLALACILISIATAPFYAFIFTILLGLSTGSGQTLIGAIWPELYGLAHLGAIRAMVMSLTVIASALAPVILGYLIDQQVLMSTISVGCFFYAITGWILISLALKK